MREKLHAQIQKLHDLLEESAINETQVRDLKKISESCKVALSEEKTDIYEKFGVEMEKNALEFEDKHPAVSQVIKEIMRTLHNLGI